MVLAKKRVWSCLRRGVVVDNERVLFWQMQRCGPDKRKRCDLGKEDLTLANERVWFWQRQECGPGKGEVVVPVKGKVWSWQRRSHSGKGEGVVLANKRVWSWQR